MYIKKNALLTLFNIELNSGQQKKKYSIELEDEERYHNQNADITS